MAGNLRKMYENRICFHGDRLRDENSCIMLSAAFAVWLYCFLTKIPRSAFCLLLSFSLVFLLAASQGWLGLLLPFV